MDSLESKILYDALLLDATQFNLSLGSLIF